MTRSKKRGIQLVDEEDEYLQITSLLRGELKQRARAMREGEVKQRWIPLRFAEWWEKHGWARMMIEAFVKLWERRKRGGILKFPVIKWNC
jgi:hypothetical protein